MQVRAKGAGQPVDLRAARLAFFFFDASFVFQLPERAIS